MTAAHDISRSFEARLDAERYLEAHLASAGQPYPTPELEAACGMPDCHPPEPEAEP